MVASAGEAVISVDEVQDTVVDELLCLINRNREYKLALFKMEMYWCYIEEQFTVGLLSRRAYESAREAWFDRHCDVLEQQHHELHEWNMLHDELLQRRAGEDVA